MSTQNYTELNHFKFNKDIVVLQEQIILILENISLKINVVLIKKKFYDLEI